MRGRWARSIAVFLVGIALFAPPGCGGGGSVSVSAPPDLHPGDYPPGDPGTAIPGIESIRAQFLSAVNQARSTGRMCGDEYWDAAPPVSWNDLLATASYLHSEDMALNELFSHAGSDDSDPGDRISREGYDWWTYGENIAVGYPSISEVMQGWLGSPGHCANIMNSDYQEIGAAFVEGPYQGNPSALYWTFDLGSR